MTDKALKLVNAFYAAKRVNHYYHMHTSGDELVNQRVSVENIHKIIELLTDLVIEKDEVDVESEFHRAFVERYVDQAGNKVNKIHVIKSEASWWKRFACVKELCHILVDTEEDFQPDPCVTIGNMKETPHFMEEHTSPEADSEYLAEVIAMELIYPLEHRREDIMMLEQASTTIEAISERRDVPRKYVSLGVTNGHFETCVKIWKSLKAVEPPNLDELL
ncbi:hypothetical protein [Tabrizicola sp. BL-A-41-H6]|uniref:hypothetical protein n=1 Tax=Tabrizicola sp. BL-A-41-H6 TaxID=3421107 RepID=UPI003D674FD4